MAERNNKPKLPPLSIPLTTTDSWFAEAPMPQDIRAETAATINTPPSHYLETHPLASSSLLAQHDCSTRLDYPPAAYDRYCDYAPELASYRPSRFLEHIQEETAEEMAERVVEQGLQEQGKSSIATPQTHSSESRMTIMTGRWSARMTFLAAFRWSGPASLRSGSSSSHGAELGRSESIYSQDDTGHLAPPPDCRITLQPESAYRDQDETRHITSPRGRRNPTLLPLSHIPFGNAFMYPRASPQPYRLTPARAVTTQAGGHGPSLFCRVYDPEAAPRLLDRIQTTRNERRRQQLLQILMVIVLFGGIAMVSVAAMLAWVARANSRGGVLIKGNTN